MTVTVTALLGRCSYRTQEVWRIKVYWKVTHLLGSARPGGTSEQPASHDALHTGDRLNPKPNAPTPCLSPM